MNMKVLVGFLSVFLLGLVSGVSLSHLLQRGPKATLPGVQFLAVQQVLLRNYGRVLAGWRSPRSFPRFHWRSSHGGSPWPPSLLPLRPAASCSWWLSGPLGFAPSTRLSIRGRRSRFHQTGQISVTGGTFFTRSGLCCRLSLSARPSVDSLRERLNDRGPHA